MSKIVIKTLWGLRRNEETPELMEAWDEFSVDENFPGWNDACEAAISSWGSHLYAHRYIDLLINVDQVTTHFDAARESVSAVQSQEKTA